MEYIDIDKLFDNYLQNFIKENMGKYTADELESKIPEIYSNFGNKKLKELGNLTPNEYFEKAKSSDLVEFLVNSVKSKKDVSDFLYEAILKKSDAENYLINYIDNENGEELQTYCINLLIELGSIKPLKKYVELMKDSKTEPSVVESVAETLCDNADLVKEEVLDGYYKGINREYFLEILTNCAIDDRITSILRDELKKNFNYISLYAGHVAKYGDERLLNDLLEKIELENISYVDFKELKLAIESLGGEYTKYRDFTKDKFFKKYNNLN